MESSDVELDLQRSVQAVLRELSAQVPALQSNQAGMWRWSLHKKLERDPARSPTLVRILLRELEKAESEDLRYVIIPLLHTLMYVLTKATGIPEELYRRTYAFCTRLLTLPAPYCTVALDCAIRLKTEAAVPGTLYQRTVIAEQNLMSELYPYQERVFLFVDPELVSASVCTALLLEIQAAQGQQTPEACMRHVVSHALQAALGEACHVGALHQKLQASPRRTLERYFHAVVAAVEQVASEGSSSRAGHLERLEEIYCSLLGPAAAARGHRAGDPTQDRPPSTPLPSPYITFHLWTDEEQLWKELLLFLRPQSQPRLSADLEALDLQGFRPDRDMARVSVLSTDSGIERDLPLGPEELPAPGSPELERVGLQRKGGVKKRAWPPDLLMPAGWAGPPGLHRRTGRPGSDGELLPGVSRLHTARVLVLGDDRMLGRLAQAYHRLRKRETQNFCLTPRLSLQLYYIPVLGPQQSTTSGQLELGELAELAAFLGRADPWYESTVNTLCAAIHKLAEMPPSLDTSRAVDPFILDGITYYVRMGTHPVYFQIYMVKGWMNEIYNYDPETYHATLTHSVYVRLEGGTLRLSKPNKNISRRASYNETKPEVTYVSQKIYDLSDSKIHLVPKSLARKRIWNKKYPICIELGRQDDFMSKAQTDKETSEEKPPAEREPASEDPKKPPQPQEGTRAGQRDQILYLFGRTGREKEEWFRRFVLASKLKSELKKPPGVSGSKPGLLPTHSRHSSPSGHLTHSRSSSKGSVEEILSQPKQKELVGSVRQKMLLDYSVYMSRCVPQENRSPHRSPVQSVESSPTAGKKLPEAPPLEEEEQEAWVNALLGRIFWDFLGEKYWSDLVSKKIQMKLSKIKLPYFMNELTLTELDMGVAVPKILQAFKPNVDHQGLWIDLEMSYNGSFLMTLETKMNLTKLGKEPLVEALKVGEIGREGCRPRAYCLADSDEESSSAGSSDEDDAPEPSAGDKQLLPGAEGYVGGHRTSKIMRFVDKITKSKYFQKATETEFIKKKIEEVSNTPLLLTVEVQECRGTLAINIPPPPTDRIWYGFRRPPHVELKARPKLGEREVTLVHVTDWIERKLEQEFQKVFVMPNMDDVYIPIMHSAMDPRSTSCLLKDLLVEAADQP